MRCVLRGVFKHFFIIHYNVFGYNMIILIHFRRYYAVSNASRFHKLFRKPLSELPYVNKSKNNVELSRTVSDTFDIFVNDLMIHKTEKWKTTHTKRDQKITFWAPKISSCDQPKTMHENNDCDIISAAKLADTELVFKILASKTLVDISPSMLENLSKLFSETGCIKGVIKIEQLAIKCNFLNTSHFYVDKLNCYKHRRENIQALKLCEDIYIEYPDLRKEVRQHLSHILSDIVSLHSEAALVKGKDVVELISLKYNDLRPMSSLWHACFLSEWFSDQQVASELLESIAKKQPLMQVLNRRISAAMYTALGQHRVDLVYNLMEDLLRLKLQTHYQPVLRALFDYKCAARDLKGCASILQTALELNVPLSSQQHTAFIDLLCQKKHIKRTIPGDVKATPPPPFQFKF